MRVDSGVVGRILGVAWMAIVTCVVFLLFLVEGRC